MSMKTGGNGGDEDINAEINMTPLIDIMLVLLIIFMVSSSAAIESGLDVNLPEVSAVSDKSDVTLVVSLSKTGELSLQGNPVKTSDLKDSLTKAFLDKKTDAVILESDGETQLSAAMEIMDIARSAGAKNFSIAAKLKAQ